MNLVEVSIMDFVNSLNVCIYIIIRMNIIRADEWCSTSELCKLSGYATHIFRITDVVKFTNDDILIYYWRLNSYIAILRTIVVPIFVPSECDIWTFSTISRLNEITAAVHTI